MNPKSITIGFLLLFITVYQGNAQSYCNETSIKILVRLYYLTNPINVYSNPSDLEEFVRNNCNYLISEGSVINLARDLGNNLISSGLQNYSQNDYDDAYESALNMGATGEMARDVASSISSASLDAFVMGQELLWLTVVMPAAAQGNWEPFVTTGTYSRQYIIQIIPIYSMTGILDDPYFQDIMDQIALPMAEYQIADMAFWLCK